MNDCIYLWVSVSGLAVISLYTFFLQIYRKDIFYISTAILNNRFCVKEVLSVGKVLRGVGGGGGGGVMGVGLGWGIYWFYDSRLGYIWRHGIEYMIVHCENRLLLINQISKV